VATDYLDLRLGDFLDGLAEGTPAPGGASAAALTAAFSASIVMMVARRSRESWPDAGGVAAQAKALEVRTAPLAQKTGRAWEIALEALQNTGETHDAKRSEDLERKLARAAEVPLSIAESAADIAALGALAAEFGDGTFRSDAASAAVLAAAAARAGAHFVAVNLTTRPDDEWLLRAQTAADAASGAATRALDAGP
jgi:formiminotetrahydrofolate cyclodeaminase